MKLRPSPFSLHAPETVPSDLVLARNIGLISVKKRHAFYKLVKRQGSADDESRTSRVLEVEKHRLEEVEQRRRERLARAREEAVAEAE